MYERVSNGVIGTSRNFEALSPFIIGEGRGKHAVKVCRLPVVGCPAIGALFR